MKSGDEKGPQIAILPPGGNRINFAQSHVTTSPIITVMNSEKSIL
jgi:hypothetical protein